MNIDPSLKSNKFKFMQEVKHVKTGIVYVIAGVPRAHFKLEASNESFYSYIPMKAIRGEDVIEWFRCVSEMEDGRFEVV